MMLFIRPLCLRLREMTGYARKFDENVTCKCLIELIAAFLIVNS